MISVTEERKEKKERKIQRKFSSCTKKFKGRVLGTERERAQKTWSSTLWGSSEHHIRIIVNAS